MDEHLHHLGDLIPEAVRALSGRTLDEPSGSDPSASRTPLRRSPALATSFESRPRRFKKYGRNTPR